MIKFINKIFYKRKLKKESIRLHAELYDLKFQLLSVETDIAFINTMKQAEFDKYITKEEMFKLKQASDFYRCEIHRVEMELKSIDDELYKKGGKK